MCVFVCMCTESRHLECGLWRYCDLWTEVYITFARLFCFCSDCLHTYASFTLRSLSLPLSLSPHIHMHIHTHTHTEADGDRVLKMILYGCKELIGAERASLFLVDKGRQQLYSKFCTGMHGTERKRRRSLSNSTASTIRNSSNSNAVSISSSGNNSTNSKESKSKSESKSRTGVSSTRTRSSSSGHRDDKGRKYSRGRTHRGVR